MATIATSPLKFTPASLIGVTEEQEFPISYEESRKHVIQKFVHLHLSSLLTLHAPIGFFCINNPVSARLQQGPTCGLVSLRMSAESILARAQLQCSTPSKGTLLEEAKRLGFTGYGEMFNTMDMAALVEKYYGPNLIAQTFSSEWNTTLIDMLLRSLLEGSIALVPYDVDKNHEPCMNGGKTAHWAAIKGLVIPLFQQSQLDYAISLGATLPDTIYSCITDSNLPFFYYEPGFDILDTVKLDQIVNPNDLEMLRLCLCVIAQQSKSKHQAIWKFTQVENSNQNLHHFDESRITEPDFVVPKELISLRGKMVFMALKKQL